MGFHSQGGTPINGWFTMGKIMKMDENWGTTISGNLQIEGNSSYCVQPSGGSLLVDV